MTGARREDIDTFRGIGCLCIVFFHYGNVLHSMGILPNYFAYGSFAVCFFFILSAFYLYQKAILFTSIRELVSYRMIRLYPSYWGGILITSVFMMFMDKDQVLNFKEILINCTMLQQLAGVPEVDGVYWTLTYELILLASLAVLKISIKKHAVIKDHFKFCVFWLAFCAAARLVCNALGIEGLKVEALLWGSNYVYAFIIGISAYHINVGGGIKWKIISAFCVCYPIIIYGESKTTICCMVTAVIGHLLLTGKFDRIKIKWLSFIGGISYEIYLLHNMIGKTVIHKIIPKLSGNAIAIFGVVLGILIFIIILAYIVNQLSRRIIKFLHEIILPFVTSGDNKKLV